MADLEIKENSEVWTLTPLEAKFIINVLYSLSHFESEWGMIAHRLSIMLGDDFSTFKEDDIESLKQQLGI